MRVNQTQWADNYATGVLNDEQKMRQGVENVTESPMKKAAANVDAYIKNTVAAAPRWKAKMEAYPLASWKDRMVNVGIARRRDSLETAKTKVAAHAAKAIPIYQNLEKTMPARGTTILANLERVKHFALGLNSAFKASAGK